LKIVQLAESGSRIRQGDLVVKFDAAAQEDRLLARLAQLVGTLAELEIEVDLEHGASGGRGVLDCGYDIVRQSDRQV
jgi:hypothetical protein